MLTRRELIVNTLAAFAGSTALIKTAMAQTKHGHSTSHEINLKTGSRGRKLPNKPIITPNGSTLPYNIKNGVKEFHLVAEPVEQSKTGSKSFTWWPNRLSGNSPPA
jgi:hypothetical protein